MSTLFTAAQIADLESQLKQRQAELDRQLAEHQQGSSRAEHARDVLQQDGDDAPQRDADREVDLERSDRELAELGQVSAALQRIHLPEFGLCCDCGERIAFERLKLEPWAERCVPCAARAEGQGTQRHTM